MNNTMTIGAKDYTLFHFGPKASYASAFLD
jgi:hypothetical protein